MTVSMMHPIGREVEDRPNEGAGKEALRASGLPRVHEAKPDQRIDLRIAHRVPVHRRVGAPARLEVVRHALGFFQVARPFAGDGGTGYRPLRRSAIGGSGLAFRSRVAIPAARR